MRSRLTLIIAVVALVAAEPAAAFQPGAPLPPSAARLHAACDVATGAVQVTAKRPANAPPLNLTVDAVRIDGRRAIPAVLPLPANKTDVTSSNAGQATAVTTAIEPISPIAVTVTWSAPDRAVHDFEIPIADNSSYYGGGERFCSLNHKGQILPIASIDRPEDKGVVSYKPVPFFMSTRGYAAWLDSAAPATFDFNATDREHVMIRCRAAKVRLVLIDGPDFASLLAEFTRLTGRPRVPPAWSFAPWKSRNEHFNRNEVLADAELTRKHDLPGSVIVIDSPWETGYNDFVLNERQFTEPGAMFARLRELGFHTCLWLTPFVNVQNNVDVPGIDPGPCRNFADAEKQGYLVRRPDGTPMLASWWKGRGALVDFTNPAAVRWWHEQLDQTRPFAVHALKCDDGEGNFVQDAVFFDGTPAAEMKNRYAALYLKAAQDYIDSRLGGDGVLSARCGFTGTQAQPFCWAGDNEASFSFENGLPSVVLAGQNAALSGLAFWGHDIAGYIGTPSKELFIRWTQFGALSPMMQVHMTSNLGPWDFDAQTLDIYRTFARLHTALFPYIFDAAHEAARTGMPLIRPMVLAFPNDPAAAVERYQYLFGPDLLVAPMVQPGEHRSVYLPIRADAATPPGESRPAAQPVDWIDFWSGKPYAGGRTIEVHAPLERMPLFVRSGALICMLPDDVDTLIPRHAGMSADVVAIDDRRILTIWSGEARSIATHDGISATTTRASQSASLRLSASSKRSIEVRRKLVHREQSNATPTDGWTLDTTAGWLQREISIGPQPIVIEWRDQDS